MARPSPELTRTRRRLRELRRSVGGRERLIAERAILRHLLQLRVLRPQRRVAAYLAFGGEVNLQGVIDRLQAIGAELYLPRVTHARRGAMQMLEADPRRGLRPNRYGILEPSAAGGRRARARELDLVLLPVLGFDAAGNRLGMGAGYYDRYLARRRAPRHWSRPRLIGIAFDEQRLEQITAAPWDVRLDLIVTPGGVVRAPPGTTHPRWSPLA